MFDVLTSIINNFNLKQIKLILIIIKLEKKIRKRFKIYYKKIFLVPKFIN